MKKTHEIFNLRTETFFMPALFSALMNHPKLEKVGLKVYLPKCKKERDHIFFVL